MNIFILSNMSGKTMELKSKLDPKVSPVTAEESCSDGNIMTEELSQMDEQIVEIQTKSGYKIILVKNASSGIERIVFSHNRVEGRECAIELNPTHNSISLLSQMDLHIKATNIEIEADKTMNLKSGSIMTINGALVKIN